MITKSKHPTAHLNLKLLDSRSCVWHDRDMNVTDCAVPGRSRFPLLSSTSSLGNISFLFSSLIVDALAQNSLISVDPRLTGEWTREQAERHYPGFRVLSRAIYLSLESPRGADLTVDPGDSSSSLSVDPTFGFTIAHEIDARYCFGGQYGVDLWTRCKDGLELPFPMPEVQLSVLHALRMRAPSLANLVLDLGSTLLLAGYSNTSEFPSTPLLQAKGWSALAIAEFLHIEYQLRALRPVYVGDDITSDDSKADDDVQHTDADTEKRNEPPVDSTFVLDEAIPTRSVPLSLPQSVFSTVASPGTALPSSTGRTASVASPKRVLDSPDSRPQLDSVTSGLGVLVTAALPPTLLHAAMEKTAEKSLISSAHGAPAERTLSSLVQILLPPMPDTPQNPMAVVLGEEGDPCRPLFRVAIRNQNISTPHTGVKDPTGKPIKVQHATPHGDEPSLELFRKGHTSLITPWSEDILSVVCVAQPNDEQEMFIGWNTPKNPVLHHVKLIRRGPCRLVIEFNSQQRAQLFYQTARYCCSSTNEKLEGRQRKPTPMSANPRCQLGGSDSWQEIQLGASLHDYRLNLKSGRRIQRAKPRTKRTNKENKEDNAESVTKKRKRETSPRASTQLFGVPPSVVPVVQIREERGSILPTTTLNDSVT